MRSNYGAVNLTKLRKETQVVAERLVKEREDEIIKLVCDSVMTQTLSVAFWVLHRDHGYGAARLQRLKREIEDEFTVMASKPMGKDYSPLDIRAELKKRFGVDFSDSEYKGGTD